MEAYQTVADLLHKKGIQTICFFQDRCLEDHFISVKVNPAGNFEYTLSVTGQSYFLHDFDAVWYIKPSIPKQIYENYPYEYAYFIQKQFYTLREGIRILFKDKKWLNDPAASFTAENKIYQLKIATQIGFDLPKTLICSNPEEITLFFNSNQRTIIKSLSPTLILDHVIYTNEVLLADLTHIDSAKYAPAIYQELIEKDYELRITVVDDKIFPAKIDSQQDSATAIDWRTEPLGNDYSVKIEKTEIPTEINEKIRALMKELNLCFGCIDMIVTKDNRYIFLEINPNGQWFFVQAETGYEIASAIADHFSDL